MTPQFKKKYILLIRAKVLNDFKFKKVKEKAKYFKNKRKFKENFVF